jgi:hypothetical protein
MKGGHFKMTTKEEALKKSRSFNKRFKNVRPEEFLKE